ncbi:hypothetical protein SteCoe_4235 [Stentor coeruleus]|uniref:Uncharacterized protein n=1 Tax=Stentor coeruleus TaxID=5963 RepID=A0A1R2CVA0_9CILI|nr:hypothetical protein SteCoe_4235 [Stentor coeruleus]
MINRKSREAFGSKTCDLSSTEFLYNWDSSIPDIVKKHPKSPFQLISPKYPKIPSVDYLKFSEKVLSEYTKILPHTVKNRNRAELIRKNSGPSDFASKSNTEIPNIKIEMPRFRFNSTMAIIQPNKIHQFKSFSYMLPQCQTEKYLINKYSIPNGLVRSKERIGNMHKTFESLTVNNPNLKVERRGVMGTKIVRISKNSRKLLFARMINK